MITYSDEQTYTVIRLLGDYSRMLQANVDELDRLRSEKITVIAQTFLLLAALGILFMIPGFMHSVFITPFVIAISSIWFYASIGNVRFLFVGLPRIKRAKKESKALIPKLEELARLAAQIAQHAEEDKGRLLELNFQIDFAVMVLNRAEIYRK